MWVFYIYRERQRERERGVHRILSYESCMKCEIHNEVWVLSYKTPSHDFSLDSLHLSFLPNLTKLKMNEKANWFCSWHVSFYSPISSSEYPFCLVHVILGIFLSFSVIYFLFFILLFVVIIWHRALYVPLLILPRQFTSLVPELTSLPATCLYRFSYFD